MARGNGRGFRAFVAIFISTVMALMLSAVDAAAATVSPVTGVSARPASDRAVVSWTYPTTTSVTGAVVRIAPGSTPPATATSGTPVASVARPTNRVTASGLKPGTLYAVSVFAKDRYGRFAARATATFRTAPAAATSVLATRGATSVLLTWKDPVTPGFTGVRIRRAIGTTAPATAAAGTAVADVLAGRQSLLVKGLLPSTTYSFSLFTYDAKLRFGNRVSVTVKTNALLAVTTSKLADGIVGLEYKQVLAASGGRAPYKWSAAGLPSGMVLDPAGVITGDPSGKGSFSVTLTVRDADGAARSRAVTLAVPTALPAACVDQACSLVVPNGRTIELTAAQVAGVTRGVDGRISRIALAGVTTVTGDILVVPPISAVPTGAFLHVDAVSTGTAPLDVQVSPASPADAYAEGTVRAVSDPVAATVTTTSVARAGTAMMTTAGIGSITCDDPTVNATLAGLTVSPELTPKMTALWKHPYFGGGGIYVGTGGLQLYQFDLDGSITLDLGVAVSGAANCTMNLPTIVRAVPAGNLGAIILTIKPSLTLKVTGKLDIRTSAKLACVSYYRWTPDGSSRAAACGSSSTPLKVSSSSGIDATLAASLDAQVTLNELVGVDGKLSASLHAGYYPTKNPAGKLDAKAGYELGACLICFWNGSPTRVTVATGTFFDKVLAQTATVPTTTAPSAWLDRVIAVGGGPSYFVDGGGVLHHILSLPTYDYLTRKYGAAIAVTDADLAYMIFGSDQPEQLDTVALEGKIIRRADGVSWVVLGGVRRHLPTYAVDVCTQYGEKRAVAYTGLTFAQGNSIPEGTAYACNLNGRILRQSDVADPKPSYAFHDGTRHWIADSWTFKALVSRGWPVVDAPGAVLAKLPSGANETPILNAVDVPRNSIIRRSDGVSWVVDGSGVRHHIPFARDDTCWRLLRGYPVSATNLTAAQAQALNEAEAWPCVVGPRVVKADDGRSYFVDNTNTRHWIQDTETFNALSRSYAIVGPWPASEVANFLAGADQPKMLDPEAVKNSIVCRSDGVCWAVDGTAVRHHIPTYGDNVCWRWVNGWKVTRNGVSFEQANSLAEGVAWPCSMNNRIIATNEGPAYYMEGNTRRWIPDGYDFECLQRGRTVIRGMALSEASGLPEGAAMPAQECAGIDIVTIYSPANGRYVTTEINYGGADYAMIRAARTSVGSDWERFRLIGNCADRCLIQSLNNRKLVLAQFDYQGAAWGELRGVSSNAAGSWEGFRLYGDCNTGCGIRALGRTADIRYVSAELDYTGAGYGMLRARATSIGGWEKFIIR